MKYTILNRRIGSALEMNFSDADQLNRWLDINEDFESLGTVEKYLPTRHVRMQRWTDKNDQFAGWGS